MSMDGEQGVAGEGRETGGKGGGKGKNIIAVLIFFVSLHFK